MSSLQINMWHPDEVRGERRGSWPPPCAGRRQKSNNCRSLTDPPAWKYCKSRFYSHQQPSSSSPTAHTSLLSLLLLCDAWHILSPLPGRTWDTPNSHISRSFLPSDMLRNMQRIIPFVGFITYAHGKWHIWCFWQRKEKGWLKARWGWNTLFLKGDHL